MSGDDLSDPGTVVRVNAVRRLGVRDLPALALTLAIAALGGAVFNYFRLPLAWMLGAMFITTPLAIAGMRLRMDSRLRTVMIVVLGVMIGGTFSPSLVASMGHWWSSLTAMTVFVAIVSMVVFVFFVKFAGFDARTAIFSSLPGGLNEMANMGAAMGADDRMISLAHSVRIFMVVMTIPFLFQALGLYERGVTVFAIIPLADMQMLEMAKIAAGVAGGILALRMLRFPSPILIGAMIGSAGVHITGFATAQLPTLFIVLAQIAIGASIGARFAGLDRVLIWRGIRVAGVTSLIMILAAILSAYLLAPWLGFEFAPLLLAFSPGGFAEMALIALALDVDTAYVSTHHIFRVMLIVLVVPIMVRMLVRAGKLRSSAAVAEEIERRKSNRIWGQDDEQT